MCPHDNFLHVSDTISACTCVQTACAKLVVRKSILPTGGDAVGQGQTCRESCSRSAAISDSILARGCPLAFPRGGGRGGDVAAVPRRLYGRGQKRLALPWGNATMSTVWSKTVTLAFDSRARHWYVTWSVSCLSHSPDHLKSESSWVWHTVLVSTGESCDFAAYP